MVQCQNCNAPVAPGHDACDFCGTLTPDGYARRAAEMDRLQREREEEEERRQAGLRAAEERALAEQRAARERELAKLNSSGTGALVLSVIGALLMCIPIISFIAMILGFSTRSAAKRAGLPAPARATAGAIVGGGSFALGAAFWALAAYLGIKEDNRKTELRAIAAQGAAAEALDVKTACAMTELHLLETEWEGYSINAEFLCAGGRVVEDGEGHAVLHDSSFLRSDRKNEVFTCFERSGSWKLTETRKDARCGEAPAGPATPTATPEVKPASGSGAGKRATRPAN